jgi:hypothetical protein
LFHCNEQLRGTSSSDSYGFGRSPVIVFAAVRTVFARGESRNGCERGNAQRKQQNELHHCGPVFGQRPTALQVAFARNAERLAKFRITGLKATFNFLGDFLEMRSHAQKWGG